MPSYLVTYLPMHKTYILTSIHIHIPLRPCMPKPRSSLPVNISIEPHAIDLRLGVVNEGVQCPLQPLPNPGVVHGCGHGYVKVGGEEEVGHPPLFGMFPRKTAKMVNFSKLISCGNSRRSFPTGAGGRDGTINKLARRFW